MKALLPALIAVLAISPSDTYACGGFFCGGVPVDQAGEDVLFVIDEGRVTAHIRIAYQGAAEDFSWVVPVSAVPEIDVGTDEVFDVLSMATSPRAWARWEGIGCDGSYYGGGSFGSAGDSDASSSGDGDSGPPPVTIVSSGAVGPFDTIVVDSSDPDALGWWLRDNGYDVPETADPIVASYVEKGWFFVALKLRKGEDTGALQPIVLRMDSSEACLPLELTAIAAVDDMPVRVWFLADGRVVPLGWLEVELNDARTHGFTYGSLDWNALVGEAADEVGGRAFFTDFAGSACPLIPYLDSGRQCPDAFRDLETAQEVMDELARQGFRSSATLLEVLEANVAPPPGVPARDFYNCPDCYGEGGSVDSDGLARDLERRIVVPIREVADVMARRPWLTALSTRVSPNEMIEDPRFSVNAALGTRDSIRQATLFEHCAETPELEDDVEEIVTEAGHHYCAPSLLDAPLTELPASERALRWRGEGEAEIVVDRSAEIDAALADLYPCDGPAPSIDLDSWAEAPPPVCERPARAPLCPPRFRSICSASPGLADARGFWPMAICALLVLRRRGLVPRDSDGADG